MKRYSKLLAVVLFVAAGASIGFSYDTAATGFPLSTTRDAERQAPGETAEQVYHNIQVLKGMPAQQLQQVMAVFTGSLGVKCSHCHTTSSFEKDDKPTKQTARRMIQMVFDLNKANFGERNAVTCYTCHRGQTKPEAVVALGNNPWLPNDPASSKPEAALPTVDQILEAYLRAAGGKEALAKLTTRISKGSRVGADGVLVPEEVFQKAPDKLLVITTYPGAALSVRLNGRGGWAGDKDRTEEVTGERLAELQLDAVFYKESSLKEQYPSMNAAGKAKVGGKEAYVIDASSRSGFLEKLYFDTETGLLVRRSRESKTVLGQFPLQTDYEDFRVVDGVKLPFTIRWSMPGRTWGRRITEVKHNVAIEDQQFDPPARR